MSLSDDVYFELAQAGLAPSVPFEAAEGKWREPILKAIGEADDLAEELNDAELRIERIEESRSQLRDEVRSLTTDLKNMTKQRDRLANGKDSVSP